MLLQLTIWIATFYCLDVIELNGSHVSLGR